MADEKQPSPSAKIAVTRESLGLRVSLPGIWAEGILFREDEARALYVALGAALPMGQGTNAHIQDLEAALRDCRVEASERPKGSPRPWGPAVVDRVNAVLHEGPYARGCWACEQESAADIGVPAGDHTCERRTEQPSPMPLAAEIAMIEEKYAINAAVVAKQPRSDPPPSYCPHGIGGSFVSCSTREACAARWRGGDRGDAAAKEITPADLNTAFRAGANQGAERARVDALEEAAVLADQSAGGAELAKRIRELQRRSPAAPLTTPVVPRPPELRARAFLVAWGLDEHPDAALMASHLTTMLRPGPRSAEDR